MPATASSTNKQLGEKLREIEADLNEARDARAAAADERDEAKKAFANTPAMSTTSAEFKAAKAAVGKVGEIDDKIAELQELQLETLRMLGRDLPGGVHSQEGAPPFPVAGGWRTREVLANEALREQLHEMGSSSVRVGRLPLGQVASREAFLQQIHAADLTGTPNMRRGSYEGVAPQLRRRLRLLDLLATALTDGNTVPYTQESGTFASAAETTEGSLKPEAGITYTDIDAPVATIAHWIKTRKQILSDFPALQGLIESRMRYGVERRLEDQVLGGNGTDPNIRGILNTSGIGSVAFSAGAELADLILTGVTQVFLSDAEPNAIAMNPSDWAATLRAKAAGDGQYFSGGPFSVTPQVMWGVPLIPANGIAAGIALVGDFAIGAQLFIRDGVNVLISDSDQDDFLRNKVTLLAEMRAALAVYTPAAFSKVLLA